MGYVRRFRNAPPSRLVDFTGQQFPSPYLPLVEIFNFPEAAKTSRSYLTRKSNFASGNPGLIDNCMKVVEDLAAGSIGGGVGCAFGHPLDTVKVRLQSQPGAYRGPVDCARQTLAHEGPRGFFKGLGPPLLSVSIYQSVCFATFSLAIEALAPLPSSGTNSSVEPDSAPLGVVFGAGCISGAATVFITTPADLVKVKLQNQTATSTENLSALRYRGMAHCAACIYKEEGLRGFGR